jgi:hypothetical protein
MSASDVVGIGTSMVNSIAPPGAYQSTAGKRVREARREGKRRGNVLTDVRNCALSTEQGEDLL